MLGCQAIPLPSTTQTVKDGVTECLQQLYWFPIIKRIKHKVLTLVFRCLKGEAPTYLQDLLILHTNSQQGLRSVLKYNRLIVPFAYRTFA